MSSTNHHTADRRPSTLQGLEFQTPAKPRGWKVNEWSQTLFGITEADGPKFYVSDGAAGVWTTWQESVGISFTIDADASAMLTMDEMQAFHDALGTMLQQVKDVMQP